MLSQHSQCRTLALPRASTGTTLRSCARLPMMDPGVHHGNSIRCYAIACLLYICSTRFLLSHHRASPVQRSLVVIAAFAALCTQHVARAQSNNSTSSASPSRATTATPSSTATRAVSAPINLSLGVVTPGTVALNSYVYYYVRRARPAASRRCNRGPSHPGRSVHALSFPPPARPRPFTFTTTTR